MIKITPDKFKGSLLNEVTFNGYIVQQGKIREKSKATVLFLDVALSRNFPF